MITGLYDNVIIVLNTQTQVVNKDRPRYFLSRWREGPVWQTKNIIDDIAVGIDAQKVDADTEEVHPEAAFDLQDEQSSRKVTFMVKCTQSADLP